MNCGHVCVCATCAQTLQRGRNRCPVCRYVSSKSIFNHSHKSFYSGEECMQCIQSFYLKNRFLYVWAKLIVLDSVIKFTKQINLSCMHMSQKLKRFVSHDHVTDAENSSYKQFLSEGTCRFYNQIFSNSLLINSNFEKNQSNSI